MSLTIRSLSGIPSNVATLHEQVAGVLKEEQPQHDTPDITPLDLILQKPISPPLELFCGLQPYADIIKYIRKHFVPCSLDLENTPAWFFYMRGITQLHKETLRLEKKYYEAMLVFNNASRSERALRSSAYSIGYGFEASAIELKKSVKDLLIKPDGIYVDFERFQTLLRSCSPHATFINKYEKTRSGSLMFPNIFGTKLILIDKTSPTCIAECDLIKYFYRHYFTILHLHIRYLKQIISVFHQLDRRIAVTEAFITNKKIRSPL